jgi:hypothetical protein
MGSKSKASCPCGFFSPTVTEGSSRAQFGKVDYMPAVCETCRTIVTADLLLPEAICDHCQSSLKFYGSDSNNRVDCLRKSGAFDEREFKQCRHCKKMIFAEDLGATSTGVMQWFACPACATPNPENHQYCRLCGASQQVKAPWRNFLAKLFRRGPVAIRETRLRVPPPPPAPSPTLCPIDRPSHEFLGTMNWCPSCEGATLVWSVHSMFD